MDGQELSPTTPTTNSPIAPGFTPYAGPANQPWILGNGVDEVVGFIAGLGFTWLGALVAVVVVYAWAGAAAPADRVARRRHARSVSLWALAGGAVLFAAMIAFAIVLHVAFATNPALNPDATFP